MEVTLYGSSVTVQEHELVRFWYSDLRNDKVAEALGISTHFLWAAGRKMGLPKRPKKHRCPPTPPKDPSADEIAAACEAIRATWSPEEERRRRFGGVDRYSIPAFKTTASKLGRLQDVVGCEYEF